MIPVSNQLTKCNCPHFRNYVYHLRIKKLLVYWKIISAMPGICSSRFNIVSQCWNMYMLIRNRLLMSTATEIPSRFRHFVMIMTQVVALKINVSFNVICSSLNVCFWYWIRIGHFQECFLLPVNLRFFFSIQQPYFSPFWGRMSPALEPRPSKSWEILFMVFTSGTSANAR